MVPCKGHSRDTHPANLVKGLTSCCGLQVLHTYRQLPCKLPVSISGHPPDPHCPLFGEPAAHRQLPRFVAWLWALVTSAGPAVVLALVMVLARTSTLSNGFCRFSHNDERDLLVLLAARRPVLRGYMSSRTEPPHSMGFGVHDIMQDVVPAPCGPKASSQGRFALSSGPQLSSSL